LPYVVGGDEGVVESHVAALDTAIVDYPILKFDPLICYRDPIMFFIRFSSNFSMHPFLYIFYQYNSIFYSHLFDVYLVNHICLLCHNFIST
jgi:hypothetical protein